MSAGKYRCLICSHVYDPREGDPDGGVEPGRPFEGLPDQWTCPGCGATRADYEELGE